MTDFNTNTADRIKGTSVCFSCSSGVSLHSHRTELTSRPWCTALPLKNGVFTKTSKGFGDKSSVPRAVLQHNRPDSKFNVNSPPPNPAVRGSAPHTDPDDSLAQDAMAENMSPRDSAFATLHKHASDMEDVHLRDLLQDSERVREMRARHGDFVLDYSRQRLTIPARDSLFKLADACDLSGRIAAQCTGEKVNKTEDRAALHVALRSEREAVIEVDGVNVVPSVHVILDKIRVFSDDVRLGKFVGATGRKLTSVLAIGIGGSYLGPRFVAEAMRMHPTAYDAAAGRKLRFLANVDPVDVEIAREGLDPSETLVVIVSKSFATPETMLNARTMRQWIVDALGEDAVAQHMVAVSTNVKGVMEFGIDAVKNMFRFSDWVGGRYSVCSAVGVLPLALHYGFDVVQEFLAGARNMDEHYMTAPYEKNLPVLMGLLGVWNSTFLGYSNRALLPYQQALVSLAPHVQQVDMESNGKGVRADGTKLDFPAGPINFGEPGTNGQHSFYQLLHQGRVVPCDFVGVIKSQKPIDVPGEDVTNHDELMCNFFAQPDALAVGKTAEQCRAQGVPEELVPHMTFPGNRPSSSLMIKELSPFAVGQLLALFEHRTAVEGFIWDINSFDQWGVELGKVLAKNVREQIVAVRNDGANLNGFNASTNDLLSEYLENA